MTLLRQEWQKRRGVELVERRIPGFVRICPYDPIRSFGMLFLLNQCPNFHKTDHARLGIQFVQFVIQPPAGLDFEFSFQNFCSVVTGDKDLFACFFKGATEAFQVLYVDLNLGI